MRVIKLYEDFAKDDVKKLKQNINDILVELKDNGFEWSTHIYKSETRIDIFIIDDINLHMLHNPDFAVSQVYEPVMTLIGFMREKYPDVEISYDLLVDDDYDKETIDEFLEKNDFETIDIKDTPLSEIDIYGFIIEFNNNEV